MTNEEIEKLARQYFVAHGMYMAPPDLESIEEFGRALVAQAYEEAATIADSWDSASNGNHARDVADDVRALKDLLAPAKEKV